MSGSERAPGSAIRIVQLQNGAIRAVGLVAEPDIRLLTGVSSVYALAHNALAEDISLADAIVNRATGQRISYDEIYSGPSVWRLLTPIDHPDPSHCLVTGTGLTHLGSAQNRQAMHEKAEEELTDSMRMFRAGLAGGRPAEGTIGTSPEWFYKGTGHVLRAHGDTLVVPPFAEDGGEEAEVAGVYVIDTLGQPRRIGMTIGNEFSDHVVERSNYLYLASSKLRACAIGPELVIDPDFSFVPGQVSIERAGRTRWTKEIATGEREMCHSLANIEHHHFKFDEHRRAGDVHVHFFGAHSLSFADGLRLEDADQMVIAFEGFGRPLRNAVRIRRETPSMVAAKGI
jgi:hypothetical protein